MRCRNRNNASGTKLRFEQANPSVGALQPRRDVLLSKRLRSIQQLQMHLLRDGNSAPAEQTGFRQEKKIAAKSPEIERLCAGHEADLAIWNKGHSFEVADSLFRSRNQYRH